MLGSDATRLVAMLRGPYLHNRSGILLLPPSWLGREPESAARLGIYCEDHRQRVLSRLAPGQRYLGVDWTELISGDLDRLARDASPDGGCVLVANFDIMLSFLQSADRDRFWAFLREGFRPAWGLLLALPNMSQRLISDDERVEWASRGRLATWE